MLQLFLKSGIQLLIKVVLTTLLFVLPLWVNAQINNENSSAVSAKERFWLSIGFGPRISFDNSGNINTALKSKADFSDYTHLYESSKEIQNPIILIGYQAKMGYTHSFGLSHAMQLDIAFGSNRAFFGGYAIGWEIPLMQNKNKLSLQPGLALMLGYSQHFIGELHRFYGNFQNQNNDPFQIGNNQYFADRLSMHITQDKVAVIYGPEVTLNFTPSFSNVGFQFSTAYYLSGAESEAVVIFDQIRNDFPKASSLSVRNAVLDVSYNDKLLTTSPFNYAGLRASFSLVFDF